MKVNGTAVTNDILRSLSSLSAHMDLRNKNYNNHYYRSQVVRYYYTLQIILNSLPKGRTLDVGSYPGHIQYILNQMEYEVEGIDLSPDRFIEQLSECKDKTIIWDIERQPFPGDDKEIYDNLLLLEVIEHLHVNPLNLLQELNRILKFGGYILLSTPNLLQFKNRVNILLGNYALEHPLSVFEKTLIHGSPGHQRLYSKMELVDMLEVYGFNVVNTWCINNNPPVLNKASYTDIIDDEYHLLDGFWDENRTILGKIRHKTEKLFNPLINNFYENIFILARKDGVFDQGMFYERIKRSDKYFTNDKYFN